MQSPISGISVCARGRRVTSGIQATVGLDARRVRALRLFEGPIIELCGSNMHRRAETCQRALMSRACLAATRIREGDKAGKRPAPRTGLSLRRVDARPARTCTPIQTKASPGVQTRWRPVVGRRQAPGGGRNVADGMVHAAGLTGVAWMEALRRFLVQAPTAPAPRQNFHASAARRPCSLTLPDSWPE